jgi:hypothetical protein
MPYADAASNTPIQVRQGARVSIIGTWHTILSA